jgi:hypothetical protein
MSDADAVARFVRESGADARVRSAGTLGRGQRVLPSMLRDYVGVRRGASADPAPGKRGRDRPFPNLRLALAEASVALSRA